MGLCSLWSSRSAGAKDSATPIKPAVAAVVLKTREAMCACVALHGGLVLVGQSAANLERTLGQLHGFLFVRSTHLE